MAIEDNLEALASELNRSAERLDDLILEVLREAVEAGASERPALERRLTRARRSLERTIVILGGLDAWQEDGD